ncbi:MAG: universal stress protein [Candidatus Melainabacteria bacterium]|nr:universal stress protein [Candidatus Melainabacteria bacterium]
MPFKNILVALDGSEYSQIAANYGLWLALELESQLNGQHVVDPRMVDFFVAPEFAEELGFSQSVETSEKVFRALKKIGQIILDLFSKEAFARGIKTNTFLDVGYVIEEIVKRSSNHDLVIVGHRGRGHKKSPAELMTGSIAERVVIESSRPVLVGLHPVDAVEQILVAYDGSEPSRGALLLAERLAISTDKRLKAMIVIASAEQAASAKLTIEQGESYLREFHNQDIFLIREGHAARTLIDYASATNSLLVLGAYGFRRPEETVLGSTTTYIVRRAKTSILVYR